MTPVLLLSANQFIPPLQEIHLDAKTTLLKEGDVATKLFFISQGCLRVYFNDDGREITT